MFDQYFDPISEKVEEGDCDSAKLQQKSQFCSLFGGFLDWFFFINLLSFFNFITFCLQGDY